MREVLLTDVALWGALILVAALIIIRRWRRSHAWIPAREPHREAPELAGQKMSLPRAASVTGPGIDRRAADGAVPRAAEGAAPRAADGAAPRPARPAPAAPPRAIEMARPQARPHRPAARRDSGPTPARAATPSEQIASYFDQADQPIADYLAAMGWSQQPPAPPVRQQPQVPVLPQSQNGATSSVTLSQGTGTRQDGRHVSGSHRLRH